MLTEGGALVRLSGEVVSEPVQVLASGGGASLTVAECVVHAVDPWNTCGGGEFKLLAEQWEGYTVPVYEMYRFKDNLEQWHLAVGQPGLDLRLSQGWTNQGRSVSRRAATRAAASTSSNAIGRRRTGAGGTCPRDRGPG